jgi:hypothetical protein
LAMFLAASRPTQRIRSLWYVTNCSDSLSDLIPVGPQIDMFLVVGHRSLQNRSKIEFISASVSAVIMISLLASSAYTLKRTFHWCLVDLLRTVSGRSYFELRLLPESRIAFHLSVLIFIVPGPCISKWIRKRLSKTLNSRLSWNRYFRHFSKVKMVRNELVRNYVGLNKLVRNFVGRNKLVRDLLMPGVYRSEKLDSWFSESCYYEKYEVNSLTTVHQPIVDPLRKV